MSENHFNRIPGTPPPAPLSPEDEIVKRDVLHYLNTGLGSLSDAKRSLESSQASEIIIFSPEVQEAARGRIVFLIKICRGGFFDESRFNEISLIVDQFKLSDETLLSPEVQEVTQDKIMFLMKHGYLLDVLKMRNLLKVPEEFFHSLITQESSKKKIHEVIMEDLSLGRIERVCYIRDELKIPDEFFLSPEVQEAAKKGIIRTDSVSNILKIIDELKVPDEIILSPEIQKAAKSELYYSIRDGATEDTFKIRDIFKLPEESVREVFEDVIKNLITQGEIDASLRIRDKFGFLDGDFWEVVRKEISHVTASIVSMETYDRRGIDYLIKVRDESSVSEDFFSEVIEGVIVEKMTTASLSPSGAVLSFIKKAIPGISKIRDICRIPDEFIWKIAKQGIISAIRADRVDDAFKIRDELKVPDEALLSPEVQEAAKEKMLVDFQWKNIKGVIRIRDLCRVSGEIFQEVLKEGMIRVISSGAVRYAIEIRDELKIPDDFFLSPEVQEAAKEGIIFTLGEGRASDAWQIRDLCKVPRETLLSPEFQESARKGMVYEIMRGYLHDVYLIKNAFGVPDEFFLSPEAQEAAKQAIVTELKKGNSNALRDALQIKNECRVSEEISQEAAKQGMACAIRGGRSDHASKIKDEFEVPDEVISSPEIQEAARVGMRSAVNQGFLDEAFALGNTYKISEEVFPECVRINYASDESWLRKKIITSPFWQESGISPDKEELYGPAVVQVYKFVNDPDIPLRIKRSEEIFALSDPSLPALWARLSHKLSPLEYSQIASGRAGDSQMLDSTVLEGEVDYDRLAEVLEKTISDPNIRSKFQKCRGFFGSEDAFRFMNRPDLARHDALFAIDAVIDLARASGLPSKRFTQQILFQVADDNATYESGSAHHEFNVIAQNLWGVEVSSVLDQAKKYEHLATLRTLVDDIDSGGGYCASWSLLRKFHDLFQLTKKTEILDELNSGEMRPELRDYVEKLAFHPNIDMTAVLTFWKDPARFFNIEDVHTDARINAVKKPSNYLSLPFLGLDASDLRDAYVIGSLDQVQTVPSMSREYRFYEDESMDPDNPQTLNLMMKSAVGTRDVRGQARNPKKLFSELQKFCREEALDIKTLFGDAGESIISGFEKKRIEKLQEILFDSNHGISRPVAQIYRVRIGKKSDPEMAIAGNDTASCMPFGSGKNNVYMFNPNCVQLVVERQTRKGVWRTAAQSVVTIDVVSRRPTSELLELYAETGHIGDLIDNADFQILPVVTCDNIEIAKNEEGEAHARIRTAYMRFFQEFLQENASRLRVDPTRVIVGMGYTPTNLGLPAVQNHFVPLAPMGYSDNVHEMSYLIETGLPSSQEKPAESGLSPMTTRDVIAVTMIEGKAYADNETLLENLHGMQNNIIGMEIANNFFGRPNLSYVYRDEALVPRGYVLAYEGVYRDLPQVYLSDLATDKESRLAGGRLIKRFFEAYLAGYQQSDSLLPPIFTNARELTSLPILQRQYERLASEAGLVAEVELLDSHERGDDTFRDVRIYLGRTSEELAEQKKRFNDIEQRGGVSEEHKERAPNDGYHADDTEEAAPFDFELE